jgi:hypothetical protein
MRKPHLLIALALVTPAGCQTAGAVLQAMSDMGSGIVAIQIVEQPDGVYVGRISVDKQEMRLLGLGASVIPRSFDGRPHHTVFSPDRLGSALLVYSDYTLQAAPNRNQQPVVHILNTGDAERGGHLARLNNIGPEISERLPSANGWYYVLHAYWQDEDHVSVRVDGSWTQNSATAQHLILTYDRGGQLQGHSFVPKGASSGASPHMNEAGDRIRIQDGELQVDGHTPVRNPQHPAISSFTSRAANGLMWVRP